MTFQNSLHLVAAFLLLQELALHEGSGLAHQLVERLVEFLIVEFIEEDSVFLCQWIDQAVPFFGLIE